jgi:hypothetical protein
MVELIGKKMVAGKDAMLVWMLAAMLEHLKA